MNQLGALVRKDFQANAILIHSPNKNRGGKPPYEIPTVQVVHPIQLNPASNTTPAIKLGTIRSLTDEHWMKPLTSKGSTANPAISGKPVIVSPIQANQLICQ